MWRVFDSLYMQLDVNEIILNDCHCVLGFSLTWRSKNVFLKMPTYMWTRYWDFFIQCNIMLKKKNKKPWSWHPCTGIPGDTSHPPKGFCRSSTSPRRHQQWGEVLESAWKITFRWMLEGVILRFDGLKTSTGIPGPCFFPLEHHHCHLLHLSGDVRLWLIGVSNKKVWRINISYKPAVFYSLYQKPI